MTVLFLLAVQAAAPADIEIRASVRARTLTIEKVGEAEVTVTAAGRNLVSVEAPKASGKKRVNNPVVKIDIEARVVNPHDANQVEQPPSE